MSLTVGAASTSKGLGFDEKEESQCSNDDVANYTEADRRLSTEDEEEEDDDEEAVPKIELGPQCTLKELSEKDKDDESLRRWKEQLLGSVDINSVGENLDPEVKILSLAIKSPGRDDIVLQIPEEASPKGSLFALKEGARYSLVFTFRVSNNIVSGLVYKNTVWRAGVKVYGTKEMIGTFSPREDPYTVEMPEEKTPSGIFARGSYSARTQVAFVGTKKYIKLKYDTLLSSLGEVAIQRGIRAHNAQERSRVQIPAATHLKKLCVLDKKEISINVMGRVGNIIYNIQKFLDDDKKSYLELNYTFDIKREWQLQRKEN